MDETVPCWLVWVMRQDRTVLLRAVDLSSGVAERHKLALLNEPDVERVYIEPVHANHLYAGVLDARDRVRQFVHRRDGD